jgi:hypothetical protein
MHPELPVVTADPTATACCYFDRPSAPERISEDDIINTLAHTNLCTYLLIHTTIRLDDSMAPVA